jgi:lysophospholipase L1-like esterase
MAHTVVLLGDSLTSGGQFPHTGELPGVNIHNLGIPGDTTWGILARLHEIWDLNPEFVFLMIGVNDLGHGERPEDIVVRHRRIWESVKNPGGPTLVLHPLLPVNPARFPGWYSALHNGTIHDLNFHLEVEASKLFIPILDFREHYTDPEGNLKEEYTLDGLHLQEGAYHHWDDALRDYLSENLENKA